MLITKYYKIFTSIRLDTRKTFGLGIAFGRPSCVTDNYSLEALCCQFKIYFLWVLVSGEFPIKIRRIEEVPDIFDVFDDCAIGICNSFSDPVFPTEGD